MPALITFLILLLLPGVMGCRPTETQPVEKAKKSSLNTFIDGATGKTAVEAGKRAEEQIKRVSETRNDALNEALGD